MAIDKIYIPAEALSWDYSEHLGLSKKERATDSDYIGVQVGGGRLAITAMERHWAEREAAGELAPQLAAIAFHSVPEGVTSSDAAAALLSSEQLSDALPKLRPRLPRRLLRPVAKQPCPAVIALQESLVMDTSAEMVQPTLNVVPHLVIQGA